MTAANRHLIGSKGRPARMKRSAFFVNTARGPIVDEEGLAWALKASGSSPGPRWTYEREPGGHRIADGAGERRPRAAS